MPSFSSAFYSLAVVNLSSANTTADSPLCPIVHAISAMLTFRFRVTFPATRTTLNGLQITFWRVFLRSVPDPHREGELGAVVGEGEVFENDFRVVYCPWGHSGDEPRVI